MSTDHLNNSTHLVEICPEVEKTCARPALLPNNIMERCCLSNKTTKRLGNAPTTWQLGEILTPKRSGIHPIHQNASTINKHEEIQKSPLSWFWRGAIVSCKLLTLPETTGSDLQEQSKGPNACTIVFSNDSRLKNTKTRAIHIR